MCIYPDEQEMNTIRVKCIYDTHKRSEKKKGNDTEESDKTALS